MSEQKSNHLINETSPYLLQHAYNPVDWYPWGEEAFNKARELNKPILLSIGYAACHWCHVMAHESFEDKETANLMNQLFVNIKVDREERPDLDKIYQTSHYLLSKQSGGWPLTIFLAPDNLTPFFSGTYFPLKPNYQLPIFKEVLQKVSEVFHQKRDEIKKQNATLAKILNYFPANLSPVTLTIEPIILAQKQSTSSYDSINGGFFGAPKFPHVPLLEFLLDVASETVRNREMVMTTLIHMAQGGIFDQLAGGFFRYTVDEKWQIPHFEKMLYDNGQLLHCYAFAAQYEQQNTTLADVAVRTGNWVMDSMQSQEGGYYSSIDADVDGEEGQFYLWDKTEIEKLLNQKEYALIQTYFGLDESPQVEGKYHFHLACSLENIAKTLAISTEDAKTIFLSAQKKLLIARNTRKPPNRDEKVLTAWNALMVKGMIAVGETFQEPRFIDSAQRALNFIQRFLWRDGRLLAVYKDGKAPLNAYLDDYAFLLDALLTSIQSVWNTEHLNFAIELANVLLTKFQDEEQGGFYFTSHDHEKLLYRPKQMADEAVPAGNGVTIRILFLLGYLLGETRYLEAAQKTLLAAWPMLTEMPIQYPTLLLELNDYLHLPKLIILRGRKQAMTDWQSIAKPYHFPVFAIPETEKNLPQALSLKKAVSDVCAYICQGTQCSAVITDVEEFKKSFSKVD